MLGKLSLDGDGSMTRSQTSILGQPRSWRPLPSGVAESFNRTLKEQIIHGRIYRNIGSTALEGYYFT